MGPTGPQGPAGPAGSAGAAFINQQTWNNNPMLVRCCAWVVLDGSAMQVKTSGGALLVQLNVSMSGGGSGSSTTCAPFLNGLWAGRYGGLLTGTTAAGLESPIQSGLNAWFRWVSSRVYPGVPADTYNFDVRCAIDFGTLSVNSNSTVSYASVIELK
jgi:hypothetical protein